MIKTLKQLNLKSKKILMRVDFNVPLDGGVVQDTFRIRCAVPTIKYCLKEGASVVLCSHLGRPGGTKEESLSLIPVGESLADLLEMPIKFSHDCISEDAHDVTFGLKPGEVHLLENLRFHKGETENDRTFSANLSKHGNVYINDAFGTSHRKHASNVGVIPFFNQKGIGFLIEDEIQFLDKTIQNPERPFVVILGGAKIKGKLDLILKLVQIADTVLIGGGMAFTFLKAKGHSVGKSLVDESMISAAKNIFAHARSNSVALKLPTDVVIADKLDNPKKIKTVDIAKIPKSMGGFDIGPNTILKFNEIIAKAGTVLWNGPMGVFENKEFEAGTKSVAESCADIVGMEKTAIVGGGDTASAVNSFGIAENMTHVSTGGGASLELLSGNILPAISALERP